MTNLEIFKILSKTWASVSDIRKIASCGRDQATIVRDEIIKNIKSHGKNLPVSKEKLVPMAYVIDYFDLNVEYISFMAQKEKLLESIIYTQSIDECLHDTA